MVKVPVLDNLYGIRVYAGGMWRLEDGRQVMLSVPNGYPVVMSGTILPREEEEGEAHDPIT